MKIVYDDNKRNSNLQKHGFDFADLDVEFFEDVLVAPATFNRLKVIGRFRNGTISVVMFLLGSEAISLISMRPASRKERMLYAKR